MEKYIKFDINKKSATSENQLISALFLSFLSFPVFNLVDFAFLIRSLELEERIEDSPIIPFPLLEDEILHFLQEKRERNPDRGKFLATNFSRASDAAYYFLTREQQEVLVKELQSLTTEFILIE